DSSSLGFTTKVCFGKLIGLCEPQDASIDPGKQAHPYIEDWLGDLEVRAETAKHERSLREPELAARGDSRRCLHSAGIVDQVAVRQVGDLLRIERLVLAWDDGLVRDQVIDEWRSRGSGIAEVAHLDRRGAPRQDSRP